jgi:hypothetical protein
MSIKYPNANTQLQNVPRLNVDDYTLFVDPDTNRVGIKTNSPSYTLQVDGDIKIGTGYLLYFEDGSSMASAALGAASSLSDNGNIFITADADDDGSGDIKFKIASKNYLSLVNAGGLIFNNVTTGSIEDSVPITLKGNYFTGADHEIETTLQLISDSVPTLRISISDSGASPSTSDVIDISFESIYPTTTNTVDLGSATNLFKDLYLEGTITANGLATLDSLTVTNSSNVNDITTTGLATLDSLAVTNSSNVNDITTTGLATLDSLAVTNSSNVADLTATNLFTNSLNIGYVSKTNSYLATTDDNFIEMDVTADNKEVTLPTAIGNTGLLLTIKKTDVTAHTVTVITTGAQTIDGDPNFVLTNQWDTVAVVSNGANWLIHSTIS